MTQSAQRDALGNKLETGLYFCKSKRSLTPIFVFQRSNNGPFYYLLPSCKESIEITRDREDFIIPMQENPRDVIEGYETKLQVYQDYIDFLKTGIEYKEEYKEIKREALRNLLEEIGVEK